MKLGGKSEEWKEFWEAGLASTRKMSGMQMCMSERAVSGRIMRLC